MTGEPEEGGLPPAKHEVLAALREETARRNGGKMAGAAAAGVLATSMVITIVLALVKGREFPVSSLISIAGGFAALIAIIGVSARHAEAVRQAEKWADPEFAPYLLEALDSGQKDISDAAMRALKVSLAPVEEGHAGLFSPAHIKTLHGLLRDGLPETAEAAAAALSKIGRADSIAVLEAAAEGRHRFTGPRADKLETGARMALADLRMRLAKEMINPVVQAAEAGFEEVKVSREAP